MANANSANDSYAKLKQHNFGLGQREVRRILNGKNTTHNLTENQIEMLVLHITDRHN